MLKIKIFTRIVPRSWIATVAVYISVVVDSLYKSCVSRVLREVERRDMCYRLMSLKNSAR